MCIYKCMARRMISIRLPQDLLDDVDRDVARLGLDRTTLVARLLQLAHDGVVSSASLTSETYPWVGDEDDAETTQLSFAHLSDTALKDAQIRLEARCAIDAVTGCWMWTPPPDGYGTFQVGGKTHRAHRASYALFRGDIPDGHHVRHLCARRACVNPQHLDAGTPTENLREAWKKRRAGTPVTPTLAAAFPATFQATDVGRAVAETSQPNRKD